MHAYDTGRPSSQLLALERIVKIKFKKKGSFQTGLRLPTILFSHPWPVEGEQKWPGDNLCGTFYCFPWTAGCVNEFCCRQYCLLSAPHILKGLLRDGGGVCVWGGVATRVHDEHDGGGSWYLQQFPFSPSASSLYDKSHLAAQFLLFFIWNLTPPTTTNTHTHIPPTLNTQGCIRTCCFSQ